MSRIVTILNVDDNEAGRYATTRILRAAGFDVIEAGTGGEGLDAARSEGPDLIILDVHLPDRSGFDVARDLRADQTTSSIPILQMSAAYRDPQDRVRGLDEGADAYLTQPVTPKELVATVRALLRMRRAERELRESEQRLHALVEGTADLVWTAWPSGSLREPESWARFSGLDPDEIADDWCRTVHPDQRVSITRTWEETSGRRIPFHAEAQIREPGGSYRWCTLNAVPVWESVGGERTVREWIGTVVDVDARHRQAELQELLARAGELLASSLDHEETLARVVGIAVPALADWCAIDVATPEGELRRLAWRGDVEGELDPEAIHAVLQGGEPVVWPSRPDPEGGESASWILVPMAVRDRVLGALSLAGRRSGRRLDETDLTAARELAHRAALAIENARLYATAAEASRAKSSFLATMSHELRTPLNAILGYADLMEAGITVGVDGTELNQLGRIKASARHLITLIDGVLVFARFEAGKEQLVLEQMDARDAAREAAAYLERLAQEKGIEFGVELPSQGIPIEADAGKVRQVLLNLLSNAVKFTTKGSVTLGLEGVEGGIEYRITDTGIGIAHADLDRVFEPFWQVPSSSTGRGGTGLGLSVSRHLVEFMGGTIGVESEVGRGTTFRVRLPLRPPST